MYEIIAGVLGQLHVKLSPDTVKGDTRNKYLDTFERTVKLQHKNTIQQFHKETLKEKYAKKLLS